MDPIAAAILALATTVITTFGPSLARMVEAALENKNVVAAVAAEDVGEILHPTTHIDEAKAFAHAHEAAMRLKQHDLDGDIAVAGLSAPQLTVVAQALSLHDLWLATV